MIVLFATKLRFNGGISRLSSARLERLTVNQDVASSILAVGVGIFNNALDLVTAPPNSVTSLFQIQS